jgi:methyl-accepting chemotaxis protein
VFRSMSIQAKLFSSFGIAVALFCAALAVALGSMRQSTVGFENFLDRDEAKLRAFNEMYAQGLQGGQALRNIVLDPANKRGYENLDQANIKFAAAYEAAVKLTAEDALAKKALADVGSFWQENQSVKGKILGLVSANNRDDAIKILSQEETPGWRKVRDQLLTLIANQQKTVESIRGEITRQREGPWSSAWRWAWSHWREGAYWCFGWCGPSANASST